MTVFVSCLQAALKPRRASSKGPALKLWMTRISWAKTGVPMKKKEHNIVVNRTLKSNAPIYRTKFPALSTP
jgi:hypothetical protein